MKLFVALLAVAASALLVPAEARYRQLQQSTQDNKNWEGRREPGDRLLYTTLACQKFDIIRQYFNYIPSSSVRVGFWGKLILDLDLPPHSYQQRGTITYIEVLNRCNDECSGSVCITAGGVGHRYVTLHFVSDYNRMINYKVRIYGFMNR